MADFILAVLERELYHTKRAATDHKPTGWSEKNNYVTELSIGTTEKIVYNVVKKLKIPKYTKNVIVWLCLLYTSRCV